MEGEASRGFRKIRELGLNPAIDAITTYLEEDNRNPEGMSKAFTKQLYDNLDEGMRHVIAPYIIIMSLLLGRELTRNEFLEAMQWLTDQHNELMIRMGEFEDINHES